MLRTRVVNINEAFPSDNHCNEKAGNNCIMVAFVILASVASLCDKIRLCPQGCQIITLTDSSNHEYARTDLSKCSFMST